MDGWTDIWTHICSDSPCILQDMSPLGPLPGLLLNCYCNVDGQGEGTADYVLPLGDWFFVLPFFQPISVFSLSFIWLLLSFALISFFFSFSIFGKCSFVPLLVTIPVIVVLFLSGFCGNNFFNILFASILIFYFFCSLFFNVFLWDYGCFC